MKTETALKEMKASLDEALMKLEQREHQLIATRMKQKVKEEKLEKDKEMFKKSTVILARQKDQLKVSVCTTH